MDSTPTPTTIGELAIFVATKLEFLEKQLEGLPSRVQALESDVANIKTRQQDRKMQVFTILGWIVAISAAVLGVIYR